MNLNQLANQEYAIIEHFLQEDITNKLLEIGLLPKTKVQLIAKAPFGGPLLIEFGNEKSRIAIRKEQARMIQISKN